MWEEKRPCVSYYLVWNNPNVVKNSTSSGVFFCVATEFLKKNQESALVYGSYLTIENEVKHVSVNSLGELYKLQGSKYVQSSLNGVFQKIQMQLKQGVNILFSGTACQIAGLLAFLNENYENLFTIEIFCHGVPSPGLFREYIKTLENVYGGKIEKFKFRNKSKTDRHGYIISFEVNGKLHQRFAAEDTYYSAFLKGESLRPSCYECCFKGLNRTGDISIGDSNNQLFHKNESISFVAVNSIKGAVLFDLLNEKSEIMEVSIDREFDSNKQLINACSKPERRDDFYYSLDKSNIEWIDRPIKFRHKIAARIKHRIPTKIKNSIKSKLRNNPYKE